MYLGTVPGLCFLLNLVVILAGQLRCLELERALRIIVERVVNVNSTVVVVVLPAAVSASSMSTAPSSLVGENRERTAEFPADTTHLVVVAIFAAGDKKLLAVKKVWP
jgi:hypothetical protein